MQYFRQLIAVTSLVACTMALALAGTELPEYKKTRSQLYLTAAQAYAKKQAEGDRVAFIDVRTRAEIAFVGMPVIADANVPFKNVDFDNFNGDKKTFTMTPNTEFLTSVNKVVTAMDLDKDQTIMLMCRSGGRSAAAANLLASKGYTRVYTVTDGFEGDKAEAGPHKGQRVVNGWKNSGAPWTTKIDAARLY